MKPLQSTPVSGAREPTPEVIAAVDLGSNSFHMIVGELRHGQLAIIDRLKETVRLSEGLKETGPLGRRAKKRALDCLARFGQRLREMRASAVRAAGTSALRRAADSSAFLREAAKALGHPVEVISGIEEARLIYKGVSFSLPPAEGPRLVMDIGGGSTELILGAADKPSALESLHIGCVSLSERYFPRGRITPRAFDRARLAARLEIAPVCRYFRGPGLQVIGTSGTILATAAVAQELGLLATGDLTPTAVLRLIESVQEHRHSATLDFPGLPPSRGEVWPGGLAILAELLDALAIEKLAVSDGALREGLLYDHLGRLRHDDARMRSIEAMAARYHVDEAQAERVRETARGLLAQCAATWKLESDLARDLLDWAARLHEIGLDISHDGFQRHGAYIVENADLPGFPRAEQQVLAFLVASQRRDIELRRARKLPPAWRVPALRLALLLRFAVLLNRDRSSAPRPAFRLAAHNHDLRLVFPGRWLKEHPLTEAELKRERGYLRKAGYTLRFA